MRKNSISSVFHGSIRWGVLYQLSVYGAKLLCGYLLALLITWVMDGRQGDTFRLAAVVLAILAAAFLPLFWVNRRYRHAMALDEQAFRELLYGKLLDGVLPVDSRGDLEVKLRWDARAVVTYFETTLPNTVGGAVILAGSTLLLCWVNWRVGLLFFALNLVQLLPILVYETWARKIHDETGEAEEENSTWLLEGYEGAHILKSYQAREWYMNRFRRLARAVMRWGFRAEGAATVETVVFAAIDSLLNYGSYVILGLFALYGGVPVAQLPLLVILAGYLFSSISSIFSLWLDRAEYQEAYRRLGMDASAPGPDPAVSPEEGALLACRGIGKSFGEKEVLRGVSLDVRQGEHVLLQGKNGSGKSTLLRILLGMETADRGTISCPLGMDCLSYALQEEAKTSLTVGELARELERTPEVDAQALRRHLARFHLEGCMDQPLSELSGGQLKRFFLSAALAKHSQLLILDEPTNHLDQESIAYLTGQLQTYPGALLVCAHGTWPGLSWDQVITIQKGEIQNES